MLLKFFDALRSAGLPVSIKEFLALLEALDRKLAFGNIDDFYLLARTCLVKDERFYDRFDRAFALYFGSLDNLQEYLQALIPEDWLREAFERSLSDAEKAEIETLGGLEKLIESFRKRLEEQDGAHHGGNKWIGSGGTSPFGHGGFHPQGIRVGGEGKNRRAAKVWEKREFRNLDDDVELGTRNIKIALRRLRKFARTGASEELDMDDTIDSTARNAGFLDIKMVAERHNAVKVLLFLDVGGSMDPYVQACEELFSAARSEFKHLEYFYFHNMLYEIAWKDNRRRHDEVVRTWDLLHRYSADYKVIMVGDASMASYELTSPGGAVEFFNEEPGAVWINRLVQSFDRLAWLNPVAADRWQYTPTIDMVNRLVRQQMFPLTLGGLDDAMACLAR